jgi:hypothetical protein
MLISQHNLRQVGTDVTKEVTVLGKCIGLVTELYGDVKAFAMVPNLHYQSTDLLGPHVNSLKLSST